MAFLDCVSSLGWPACHVSWQACASQLGWLVFAPCALPFFRKLARTSAHGSLQVPKCSKRQRKTRCASAFQLIPAKASCKSCSDSVWEGTTKGHR